MKMTSGFWSSSAEKNLKWVEKSRMKEWRGR